MAKSSSEATIESSVNL